MKRNGLKTIIYILLVILICYFVFYVVSCSIVQYRSLQMLDDVQRIIVEQSID